MITLQKIVPYVDINLKIRFNVKTLFQITFVFIFHSKLRKELS